MVGQGDTEQVLGINGLGRIGKLSLWHHVERKYFTRIVANVGRPVGRDLDALCGMIEKDSTYGSNHRFLFGVNAAPCVRIVDRERNLLEVAGVPVTMNQAIAAARVNGRVVVLGNPSADVTLPAALISQAMRRELDIFGTWNSAFSAAGNNDDWREVLRAAAAGAIDLDCLVSHRVPLSGAMDALVMMRDQSEFFAKVLIQP